MAEMRRMQSDDDDLDTEKIFFLKFILTLTGEIRPKPPSCVVIEETLGVGKAHYDVTCNTLMSIDKVGTSQKSQFSTTNE